jgi:UDP-galactopyranose mutase
VTYEYPCDEGDPYYPVPQEQNMARFKKYEGLARKTPNVWFVGRLATYRYYNMDQVVGQALSTFRRIQAEIPIRPGPNFAHPVATSGAGIAVPGVMSPEK